MSVFCFPPPVESGARFPLCEFSNPRAGLKSCRRSAKVSISLGGRESGPRGSPLRFPQIGAQDLRTEAIGRKVPQTVRDGAGMRGGGGRLWLCRLSNSPTFLFSSYNFAGCSLSLNCLRVHPLSVSSRDYPRKRRLARLVGFRYRGSADASPDALNPVAVSNAACSTAPPLLVFRSGPVCQGPEAAGAHDLAPKFFLNAALASSSPCRAVSVCSPDAPGRLPPSLWRNIFLLK